MSLISTRVLVPLAIACALLAGCSSPVRSSSSAGQADSVPNSGTASKAGGLPVQTDGSKTGALPQAPTGDLQQIVRSATMTVVVPDVSQAATQLRAIALGHGGTVTMENVVSGGEKAAYPISTVVLSVPADQLDTALTDIAAIGDVTLRTIASTDVTAKVADVDSRITTMRASIARIRDLLTRAGSVAEIAQVENELTARESELESLLAQQKALAQRVAQSPITVTLSRVPVVQPPAAPETGFLAGLKAGWHAFVVFAVGLATVFGALLPFLVTLAVIGVPVAWLVRRRLHRRQTTAGAAGDADTPH
ncbi:MAG TPA: DUF4349 domain-containing protein [Propionibacteriaceae bacterium]|nr:DUF4349 domain-containing protein [Propionibacteriaceae bacterium]